MNHSTPKKPSMLDGLINLIYPPLCPGCERVSVSKSQFLCVGCFDELDSPDMTDFRWPADDEKPPDHLFVLSSFDHGGIVQRLQHGLKYAGRPNYGLHLGKLIGLGYKKENLPTPELIIPIPLATKRKRERGYNQSLKLAEGFGSIFPEAIILENGLHRNRNTITQTKLNIASRYQNVAGAFSVEDADILQDKNVILIDDVLTTGATLLSAAEPLISAGGKTVTAVTFAYALNT